MRIEDRANSNRGNYLMNALNEGIRLINKPISCTTTAVLFVGVMGIGGAGLFHIMSSPSTSSEGNYSLPSIYNTDKLSFLEWKDSDGHISPAVVNCPDRRVDEVSYRAALSRNIEEALSRTPHRGLALNPVMISTICPQN